MATAKPSTVDEYMEQIASPTIRAALEDLRRLIRSVVPDAKEGISYGIPTFKLGKKALSIGAFSRHASLFLGSTTREFEHRLAGFKTAKGTIRFTPENPIPTDLVREMVQARFTDVPTP